MLIRVTRAMMIMEIVMRNEITEYLREKRFHKLITMCYRSALGNSG
jgi:hypothetical protein